MARKKIQEIDEIELEVREGAEKKRSRGENLRDFGGGDPDDHHGPDEHQPRLVPPPHLPTARTTGFTRERRERKREDRQT